MATPVVGPQVRVDVTVLAPNFLFADPMWRGVAAYRAGRYDAAVEAFAHVDPLIDHE